MNITDIDDKIIKRARQNHLYEQYLNKNLALSKILEDVESAMKPFIVKLEKEEDPDKKGMYVKIKAKVEKALSEVKASQDEGQSRERLCVDGKDVLCDWLDKTHGSEVTDNSIFARLPQFFEEDFHKDMEALNEFFLNVKNLLRTTPGTGVAAFEKWNPEDVELNKKYLQTKDAVHEALCDNVNTRTALESLRELIGEANIYMANARGANRTPNRMILKNIASYIMYLLKVFGAIEVEEEIGFPQSTTQNVNIEEAVMPFLSAFAQFREDVRTISREQKATGILKLCDELRDDVLPNLGVRLEDGISPPTIKLVDRDTLMKEREEKLKKEELKRLEKEKKKQEMEAKLAQEKIPPWELFKKETDKYSQFDDKGIPTHDAEGKEISKGQIKKLTKLYEKQEKSYNKHMGITGKEGGS
uniref:Cysteine--tRNA ligase, cytoplasmic n=1 Tax=Magallana gigas TaxID=29159 RepID=K1RR58_MAGGI